jgi:hypothetical protein
MAKLATQIMVPNATSALDIYAQHIFWFKNALQLIQLDQLMPFYLIGFAVASL